MEKKEKKWKGRGALDEKNGKAVESLVNNDIKRGCPRPCETITILSRRTMAVSVTCALYGSTLALQK